MFQKNVLISSSGPKRGIHSYQTSQRHVPEDGRFHGHHCEHFKICYYTFSTALRSFVSLIRCNQHSPGMCSSRTDPVGDGKANIIKFCFRNLAMLT
jgi:hypothetical protein